MLELRQLTAGYGREPVLRAVDLTAAAGEITTIIGKNGCGKSTLLKTAAGILTPSGGDVLVDGQSVLELSSPERARRMAYLAQGKSVPDITAGRMVLHGRFPHLSYPRRYGREDRQIAAEAMETMGISHLAERPLAELSGGMRQKVYIAMALAQQSPVILMDEPTTYLDLAQQLNFARLARELAEQGKAVVLVLHDLLLALRVSQQIVVLEDGRVAARGTPEEILTSGAVERLYGVSVKTVETELGTQLFYDY